MQSMRSKCGTVLISMPLIGKSSGRIKLVSQSSELSFILSLSLTIGHNLSTTFGSTSLSWKATTPKLFLYCSMIAGILITSQENSLIQFPAFIIHNGFNAQAISNLPTQFTEIMCTQSLVHMLKALMLLFGICTMKSVTQIIFQPVCLFSKIFLFGLVQPILPSP